MAAVKSEMPVTGLLRVIAAKMLLLFPIFQSQTFQRGGFRLQQVKSEVTKRRRLPENREKNWPYEANDNGDMAA